MESIVLAFEAGRVEGEKLIYPYYHIFSPPTSTLKDREDASRVRAHSIHPLPPSYSVFQMIVRIRTPPIRTVRHQSMSLSIPNEP